MSDIPTTWTMYATNNDGRYTNLGSYRYVLAHGLSYPITQVTVTTCDPSEATHWGWIATDTNEPIMIWPNKAAFDCCFTYGPAEEEKAGRGHVVRLLVTEKETASCD